MLRVTDAALLIKAHPYRNEDFEEAAHSVLGAVAREQGWRDEQTAHIYAVVVEGCPEDRRSVSDIEAAILHGFQSRPQ